MKRKNELLSNPTIWNFLCTFCEIRENAVIPKKIYSNEILELLSDDDKARIENDIQGIIRSSLNNRHDKRTEEQIRRDSTTGLEMEYGGVKMLTPNGFIHNVNQADPKKSGCDIYKLRNDFYIFRFDFKTRSPKKIGEYLYAKVLALDGIPFHIKSQCENSGLGGTDFYAFFRFNKDEEFYVLDAIVSAALVLAKVMALNISEYDFSHKKHSLMLKSEEICNDDYSIIINSPGLRSNLNYSDCLRISNFFCEMNEIEA